MAQVTGFRLRRPLQSSPVIPAERSESRDPTRGAGLRGELDPGSALRAVRDDKEVILQTASKRGTTEGKKPSFAARIVCKAPGPPSVVASPTRGAERRQALGAEAPHPVARLAVGPISEKFAGDHRPVT